MNKFESAMQDYTQAIALNAAKVIFVSEAGLTAPISLCTT